MVQLWEETERGETQLRLEGTIAVRHVRVVTVHVTDSSGMVRNPVSSLP